MYPELKNAGGLGGALNLEFEKLNSSLRVSVNSNYDKVPLTIAIVESDNKFSQIYIAAEKKLYLPDFWRDGVCLANGKTNDITELALAVDYWLSNNVSTQALAEKFDFIKPSDNSSAFDEGKEVEHAWDNLSKRDYCNSLQEFITLAIKDEALSKLFPFTGLYTLRLSRCTGYPFDTTDLPNVTAMEYIHFAIPKNTSEYSKIQNDETLGSGKIYVVTKDKMQYLGKGNASEALKIVRQNLPGDIQPARKGTAEG